MAITFPLSVSIIKTQWELRGFPCVLSEEQWSAIIDDALQEFQAHASVKFYAKFETEAEVQDYKICDPTDLITGGVAQHAMTIDEVYWNPGGDWSSLNLLSPGWQLLSHILS